MKEYVHGPIRQKQISTPKSEFNLTVETNRLKIQPEYIHAVKNGNGKRFFTQRKMAAFRRLEARIYGERSRGLVVADIHPWNVSYI